MHVGRIIATPLAIALGLAAGHAGEGTTTLAAVPDRPERELNPFVLTALVSPRLVVEIDWVEGYRPTERAVRAARAALREHCEPDRRVEVLVDDEIPRAVWLEAAGRTGLETLVARHLDRDPTDWTRAEVVYVLYAPDSEPWYEEGLSGITDRVLFLRDGEVAAARTVLLFTDEIRRDAMMWITAPKVERSTLVHELGHVIGLVGNPDHAQQGRPGHCSVARCVMHQPGARAGFVNGLPALFAGRIPGRYGARCSRDIAEARRGWRERARAEAEFANAISAARRLREKAEAEVWRASRRIE